MFRLCRDIPFFMPMGVVCVLSVVELGVRRVVAGIGQRFCHMV